MFTTSTASRDAQRSLELGADAFLTKPPQTARNGSSRAALFSVLPTTADQEINDRL